MFDDEEQLRTAADKPKGPFRTEEPVCTGNVADKKKLISNMYAMKGKVRVSNTGNPYADEPTQPTEERAKSTAHREGQEEPTVDEDETAERPKPSPSAKSSAAGFSRRTLTAVGALLKAKPAAATSSFKAGATSDFIAVWIALAFVLAFAVMQMRKDLQVLLMISLIATAQITDGAFNKCPLWQAVCTAVFAAVLMTFAMKQARPASTADVITQTDNEQQHQPPMPPPQPQQPSQRRQRSESLYIAPSRGAGYHSSSLCRGLLSAGMTRKMEPCALCLQTP